jgi:hypothetical protein
MLYNTKKMDISWYIAKKWYIPWYITWRNKG